MYSNRDLEKRDSLALMDEPRSLRLAGYDNSIDGNVQRSGYSIASFELGTSTSVRESESEPDDTRWLPFPEGLVYVWLNFAHDLKKPSRSRIYCSVWRISSFGSQGASFHWYSRLSRRRAFALGSDRLTDGFEPYLPSKCNERLIVIRKGASSHL